MMRLIYTSTFWVLFALCVISCRPEGDIVREDKDNFTPQDQAKVGNALEQHIFENLNEYSLYHPNSNSEIYDYLNAMLNQVVTTSEVQNRNVFDWKIYIVRDQEKMTSYTLPGGKIFITDGFLKFINSESQLLAVISHEMSYADHGVAMKLLEDNYSGLALGDLIFDNPVKEIFDMVNALRQIPFDPLDVERADLYSAEILCPFNYAADALATLLEKELPDDEYPFEWKDTRPDYADNRPSQIRNSARECGEESEESKEKSEENYKNKLLNYLD